MMDSFQSIRQAAKLAIIEAFGLSVDEDALIFQLRTYTVATLPAAATYPRGVIYVSDEAGGAVLAFSNSTNWLRVTDRAIVS